VSLLLLNSEDNDDLKADGLNEKFYLSAAPKGIGAKTLGDFLGDNFRRTFLDFENSVMLNIEGI